MLNMIDRRYEIKRIFGLMIEKKAPFIVLRSYDFLKEPAVELPADIDILVPYSAYPIIKSLFFEQMYHLKYGFNDCNFIKLINKETVSIHIQFDCLRAANMPYLSYSEALKYVLNVSGYPCLSGSLLLVQLLIHCIIDHGTFKATHRQKIKNIIRLPGIKEEAYELLSKYFPKRIVYFILHFAKEGKFKKLERKRLIYTLYFLFKRPWQFMSICKYIISRLKQKLNLPKIGLITAFIGIDGVGKTTLCHALVGILRRFGYKTRYIYMGRVREHVLPMDKISKKVGVSRIKKERNPNQLYLLARDLIYILDMFLRYLFFILPYKIFDYIVICDRYAYDIYLDKHQTFLSRWVLKHIYPNPEILVFLQLPEEEIIKRKNEYNTAKRQILMRRWNEVAHQFKPHNLISDDLERNTFLVHELIQKFHFEKIWLKKADKNAKKKCS